MYALPLGWTPQSRISTMPGCRISEVARASLKNRDDLLVRRQLGQQHLDRRLPTMRVLVAR